MIHLKPDRQHGVCIHEEGLGCGHHQEVHGEDGTGTGDTATTSATTIQRE